MVKCDRNPHMAAGAFNTEPPQDGFKRDEGDSVTLECKSGYDGKVTMECGRNNAGDLTWTRTSGVCTGVLARKPSVAVVRRLLESW